MDRDDDITEPNGVPQTVPMRSVGGPSWERGAVASSNIMPLAMLPALRMPPKPLAPRSYLAVVEEAASSYATSTGPHDEAEDAVASDSLHPVLQPDVPQSEVSETPRPYLPPSVATTLPPSVGSPWAEALPPFAAPAAVFAAPVLADANGALTLPPDAEAALADAQSTLDLQQSIAAEIEDIVGPEFQDGGAESASVDTQNHDAAISARSDAAFELPIVQKPAAQTLSVPVPQLSFEPARSTGIGSVVPDRPAVAEPKAKARPSSRYRPFAFLKTAAKVLSFIVLGYLALVLVLIVAFREINPPASALMMQQWLEGAAVTQEWVALEDMSPNVVRAVLLSEDGRFCSHYGIDLDAIHDALEKAGDGTPRGASTLSMQVIKNLFLWPSKSYLRKAIEAPLTLFMELLWPKRRIMEVYLNIAEWGPGIFGVEAASRYHFNKSSGRLSDREAARLAVALPNPLMRDAGSPGPGTLRLANIIQSRMRIAPASQTACVLRRR